MHSKILYCSSAHRNHHHPMLSFSGFRVTWPEASAHSEMPLGSAQCQESGLQGRAEHTVAEMGSVSSRQGPVVRETAAGRDSCRQQRHGQDGRGTCCQKDGGRGIWAPPCHP